MAASDSSRRLFRVFVTRVPWTKAERSLVLSLVDSIIEEVTEYFAQFGSVKKCALPFDKGTGFHKGLCWIGFSAEEGLKNALQKDSHILEGAKLEVKHQKSRGFAGQHSDRRTADFS
ncbi:SRA stem-loop-interacting RNA-binding protein, mitochondrial [Rhineura floridana]|uniref:SRA stem-loop-interacting RNA-binding protein, mitochondrial n=1 Tax=Rhineura floridana TaxID=261503 RepID=UPI002AC824C3|nr:SRA stem-loop-interacting RNA-binding protein, mitochondrial [Rhineura floridana]